MSPIRNLRPFKPVPFDIFERIMFFSLYSGNEFSAYMQHDDISGHFVDFPTRQATFINMFATVNRDVNRACVCLYWKVILLRTSGELSAVLETLTTPPSPNDVDYGSLCWRMELRIQGGYSAGQLGALISRTPNLKVFILRNVWPSHNPPMRIRPVAIVDALSAHSTGLLRIQFESQNEEPNLFQTKTLLRSLPQLVTFHLDRLCVKPYPDDSSPLPNPHPNLEVLSIGSAVPQSPWAHPYHRTGHILRCFPTRDLLPALTSLYIFEPSISLRPFLTLFAPQIEELGFSRNASWVARGEGSHIMHLCPSLKRVVWVAPEGPDWQPSYPLPTDNPLEDVILVYINRRPTRSPTPARAILDAMLSLQLFAPSLKNVHIVAPPAHAGFEEWASFRYLRRTLVRDGVNVNGPSFSA